MSQDMNEPANFDTNEEKPWNWPDDRLPYWSLQCPTSYWDDPPYRTSKSRHHISPGHNIFLQSHVYFAANTLRLSKLLAAYDSDDDLCTYIGCL